MKIVVQSLILWFACASLAGGQSVSDFSHCPDCSPSLSPAIEQPSTGLLVTIDPDRLVGTGLVQSWSCVNGCTVGRRVSARPFSKVNLDLGPQYSFDGALIKLQLEGASAGETEVSGRHGTILLDSLTRFEAKQLMRIDSSGVRFSRPTIDKVAIDRSLNKVESSKPLAGAFVKAGMRLESDRVESETREFARRQIERKIFDGNVAFQRSAMLAASRLRDRFPVISGFDWHFSSDNRNLYIAAITGPTPKSPPAVNLPVCVSMHEELAELMINARWGNQTVDATTIRNMFSFANNRPAVDDESGDEAQWQITLPNEPVTLNFHSDSIEVQLTTDQIESEEKSISSMVIGFTFRWQQQQKQWSLVRDGEVSVSKIDGGDRLGARQRVFRTVMRKRFEKLLPQQIPLSRLQQPRNSHSTQPEFDLSLDHITSDNGFLVIGLDRR